MLELLDITPGSVSVLGLMNDRDARVRLLIDRDLLDDAYLCCHPCINTSTLKLRMADAVDVLIPALGARADVCRPAGICPGDLRLKRKKSCIEDAGFFMT